MMETDRHIVFVMVYKTSHFGVLESDKENKLYNVLISVNYFIRPY